MSQRSPAEMREHLKNLRKQENERKMRQSGQDRRQPDKSPAQVREELDRYRGGRKP